MMAHMKVYEDNMVKLVKALPMNDVTFTTQLSSKKILPASINAHIKSLPTKSDKADYYLNNVIKSSLDIGETKELETLITVMNKCGYPHVERLAKAMKSNLDKQLKGKSSSKTGDKREQSTSKSVPTSKRVATSKSVGTSKSVAKSPTKPRGRKSVPSPKTGDKRKLSTTKRNELLEYYGFKTGRNHDLEEEARERQELLELRQKQRFSGYLPSRTRRSIEDSDEELFSDKALINPRRNRMDDWDLVERELKEWQALHSDGVSLHSYG